jgi:hypothetical protein
MPIDVLPPSLIPWLIFVLERVHGLLADVIVALSGLLP